MSRTKKFCVVWIFLVAFSNKLFAGDIWDTSPVRPAPSPITIDVWGN